MKNTRERLRPNRAVDDARAVTGKRKERSLEAGWQEWGGKRNILDGDLVSPAPLARRSLLISRLLCEGREGSEELPDSLEIRFRNPVERYTSSESRCVVGDLAIRPALGFPNPDAHFQLSSRRQWDRHFNVTPPATEFVSVMQSVE
jgi:hypothetical protein